MSQSLGSLFVDLKANTADFVSGMSAARYAAHAVGKDIETSFSRLGSVASSALAPFGEIGERIGRTFETIGGAAGRAMTQMGKMGGMMGAIAASGAGAATAVAAIAGSALAMAAHAAKGAAELYDLAQSTGLSTEALSVFHFVAKEAGVSAESMTRGLEKMSKSAFAAATAPAGATNAYTRLGISIRNADGSLRSAQALFTDLSASFASMPDGIAKTALAIQIFGKSGADLIPVLNLGSEEIAKFIELAKTLGLELAGKTALAAHQFEEQMTAMSAAGEGLSLQLMTELLPALQTVSKQMVDGLKDPDSQLKLFISGVATLTKTFLDMGASIWAAFKEIGLAIGTLAASIMEAVSGEFRELDRLIHFDVAGAEAATKDSAARQVVMWKRFADETGKIHSELAAFTKGLWSDPKNGPAPPTRTGSPGVDTTAAAGKQKLSFAELLANMHATLPNFLTLEKELDAIAKSEWGEKIREQAKIARDIAKGILPDLGFKGLEVRGAGLPDPAVVKALSDEVTKLKGKFTELADDSEARKYDFVSIWEDTLEPLKAYRAEIVELGRSTLLVDAAMQEGNRRLIEQWDAAALRIGNLHEKFRGFFNEIILEGKNFGEMVFQSLGRALDGVEDQLAQLVVTGKADFKQLLQSLEMDVLKATFKSVIGSITAKITGGLQIPGLGGGGQLGSSPQNPMHTKDVNAAAGGGAGGGGEDGDGGDGEGGGPGGKFKALFGQLGSVFGKIGGEIGKIVTALGGVMKSAFSGIAGLFGGHLAMGGDVVPGRAYVVGEHHPEFFVPRMPGQVMTSAPAGGHQPAMINHFNINGVQDFDSFKNSQSQLMAEFQHQLAVAFSRNKRFS